MNVYSSSMGISLTALTVVAALEIFMLFYTIFNSALYGPFLWRYRAFYLVLLGVALVSIALNIFVKRDVAHRYKVLNYANPLCAVFFFAWSLLVTYSDVSITGILDPMVFMTFSLTVPLSFFLFPAVYAVIVTAANAVMIYITVSAAGGPGPLINFTIFFIFQIVLGFTFLRIKTKLADRMVQNQENAGLDVMTGFYNRRVYEEDLKSCKTEPVEEDFVYITFDINGLKEVNDSHGHDAGDKLIVGTAACIEQCFGEKGNLYRTGGDEFVAMLSVERAELDKLFAAYDESLRDWSEANDMTLSVSYGFVYAADLDDVDVTALAKTADAKMYAAKVQYYRQIGVDRRTYGSEFITD